MDLGVDQDVDPVLGHAEQIGRLDQLQALVHHGGAVDRDLARPCSSCGWAQACSGVARGHRFAASRCGTGRPRRSGSAARPGRGGSAPGRWRCARNRPAAASRRLRGPPRCSSGPAQTRLSLLASATSAPRRTAARVGASPAAPTMADITQSAGRAPASSSAVGPGADFDARARESASRARLSSAGSATAAKRGRQRRLARRARRRCGRRSAPRPRISAPCAAQLVRSGRASSARPSRWTPRIETVRPAALTGRPRTAADERAARTRAQRPRAASPPSGRRRGRARRHGRGSGRRRPSRRSGASGRTRTDRP